MDRKKVILLVAALLIAAVTALMARSMFNGASAPQSTAAAAPAPVPAGPKVLVATKALPVGTIITADSVRYQPWPKELIEAAYFKEGDGGASIDSLVGTVVRNAVTAGQPLTQGSIVKPGDRGFLAAALGPGMRAVTVPVSALTGVAGFVFPGDRVDLVLTQNVEASAGPPLKVSETIVRNLRVLATDQRATPSVDEKGNTVVSEYKLVTIEATPRIAEKITVAQSIGTISLSLRSLADNAAELEQALASGDINIPEGATVDQERAIMRQLAQRPSATKSSYATGGDVSRFQRSSMPEQMPLAVAAEQARTQKQVEKIMKGPVVRVSRGGNVTEIDISRR
ncbi:Flp pilus assembly protein CpaB [Sphingorhabdus sp.]|jgi:pilus assembly protein CpaB|uniref:Flp pilus assembly protein CpaB n=1 Tax=Sphingorhabdus sp. TaxID=1902408 RepID=UPI0037844E35